MSCSDSQNVCPLRSTAQGPRLSPSAILHAEDWADLTPQQPLLPPQTLREREARRIALQVLENPLLKGLLLALLATLLEGRAPSPDLPVSWWILELLLEVADV